MADEASNEQEPLTPDVETPHAGPIDDVQKFANFWKTQGLRIAVYIAVLLIVVIGFAWFKGHKRAGVVRASEMLGAAQSAQDLQAILSQYPDSPSAKVAMLMLGKAYYDAGSFQLAEATYSDFLQRFPNHPMGSVATLGRIHVQDGAGQTEQAIAGYKAFIKGNSDHYLVGDAVLGLARCITLQGRTGEARVIYEDFLAAHPESGFVADVEAALILLKRTETEQPIDTTASPVPQKQG